MLPIGESHFNTLRSQTAEGLYGTSVSRNSAIALLCTPGLLDPHLQAILNTIKTARYFLLKGTQEQATMFLQMASRHSGLSYQCHGPAACLKYYLLKLGWTFAATGDVHVLGGRTQPSGIKVRPIFFRQSDVVTLLQQYLLKTKSQSFDECPPIQLGPPMVDPQQLKMEISGSWNARTLQFRRGAAYIRKWRENPQQGLQW